MSDLILILVVALVGGLLARLAKVPVMVGYIVAGLVVGLFGVAPAGISEIADIGVVLLLFSVGLEISLDRFIKVGRSIILVAIIQIGLFAFLGFVFLNLLGFDPKTALFLSLGFSLSSTALVVKILGDRGELSTIHGQIMTSWLLTQDLVVIFLLALLPVFLSGTFSVVVLGKSILTTIILAGCVFVLGRLVSPFLIQKTANTNSRELMLLTGVIIALGMAFLASAFGLPPALGAFLAGVVISQTQENHAIFAETRPLRDLLVIVFFVSLGFMVNPQVLISNLTMILGIFFFVLLVKTLVVFLLAVIFGYKGKTLISVSLGLSQVGEFAFVLFLAGAGLGIISESASSIGISVTLLTLLVAPLLFRSIVPLWRNVKHLNIFSSSVVGSQQDKYENHIIICGFGRMGRWVGRALEAANIPFVVVEYNTQVAHNLRSSGISVIYGDPAESGVIEAAGVRSAKLVVITIPDRVTQEELITYIQTVNPASKIIGRAHLDEDFEKLKSMKIDRVVQPEFEAALLVIKEIFRAMGKTKEETVDRLKSLRLSHSVK